MSTSFTAVLSASAGPGHGLLIRSPVYKRLSHWPVFSIIFCRRSAAVDVPPNAGISVASAAAPGRASPDARGTPSCSSVAAAAAVPTPFLPRHSVLPDCHSGGCEIVSHCGFNLNVPD